MSADVQGDSASFPVVYIPTGAAAGTMEDETISLQLTEDGKLILPPGLKLYMADGQEVCTTPVAEGQVQPDRSEAAESTSNHLPVKDEESSGQRQSAGSNEECQA